MPAAAQALQGVGQVKAMDISHYQGNVDWSAVKGDGVKVAYLKASEGKDYVDGTYAKNRAAAAAQGIVTGAYDFAKPGSTSPGDVVADAKAEAAHFLKTAGVKKGDLAPALDLEDAGKLNKAQLAQWVKTWGETVKAATGTTPTLYTSPSFWNSKVGSADAATGFKLWIAHWGVASPTVPAGWQSWAGWQTGSSGAIAGINGRVDTDVMKDPASMLVGA